MLKRLGVSAVMGVAALLVMPAVANAVQGPDSKHAFPVVCQTGNLKGQTVTVVNGKTAYLGTTQLRLTALRLEAFGKVKENQFGQTDGDLTCGGSETTPEGTFSFFATLIEV